MGRGHGCGWRWSRKGCGGGGGVIVDAKHITEPSSCSPHPYRNTLQPPLDTIKGTLVHTGVDEGVGSWSWEKGSCGGGVTAAS